MKLDSPMYSKQINKIWSLKSLVMLKAQRQIWDILQEVSSLRV